MTIRVSTMSQDRILVRLSFAEVHKSREQKKKKSKEVQSLSLQASLAFSDLLPSKSEPVFSIIAGRRGLLCSLLSFFLPGET